MCGEALSCKSQIGKYNSQFTTGAKAMGNQCRIFPQKLCHLADNKEMEVVESHVRLSPKQGNTTLNLQPAKRPQEANLGCFPRNYVNSQRKM